MPPVHEQKIDAPEQGATADIGDRNPDACASDLPPVTDDPDHIVFSGNI